MPRKSLLVLNAFKLTEPERAALYALGYDVPVGPDWWSPRDAR